MGKVPKIIWQIVKLFTIIFVGMNAIALFHSYKFTHFADNEANKTKSPEKLSAFEKIGALFLGVNNPRPLNKTKPSNYDDIKLQSNKEIECWYSKKDSLKERSHAKGVVIICHGYGAAKSSMLDKAAIFDSLQYNTFLIDFMGSGGSEGNITTIGYKEAAEVKTAYDYLSQKGVENIYLFGTSMGAVAILKAINDYNLKPKAVILECPFGSMYKTVSARFRNMNVPAFPMAGLLVFWGGAQNGFWAFGHNPAEYAKNVNCPILLLYGEKDRNVSREEIDAIYTNLKGNKTLKTYKLAGHENYLLKYKDEWTSDIEAFLSKNEQ